MSIPNISNEQKMAVKVKSLKWGMIKPEQILWSKNPGELPKTSPRFPPPSSLFLYLFLLSFSPVPVFLSKPAVSRPICPPSRPLETSLCPKNQLLTHPVEPREKGRKKEKKRKKIINPNNQKKVSASRGVYSMANIAMINQPTSINCQSGTAFI